MGLALEQLRSRRPPTAIRVLLVMEVLAYVGLFAAYVWTAAPGMSPSKSGSMAYWQKIALAGVLLAIPIVLNLLHGDRPGDSGLRVDNIRASLRLVVPATLVLAAGAVVAGFVMNGWGWAGWTRFMERLGAYLVWGIAQQYLLQAFSLNRLRQATVPPAVAAVLAAGLFAMLHAPNWPLVCGTAIAGIVWCSIFLRAPNILTLGAAHTVLGVLVYHAWYVPAKGLTIGPAFMGH